MKERTFLITDTIYAVARFATEASWHFEIEERDKTYPNVSSQVGVIDVHYPCQEVEYNGKTQKPVFRATVVFDPKSLEYNYEVLPSDMQFREALFREFDIGEDACWYFGYYEESYSVEDLHDRDVYI